MVAAIAFSHDRVRQHANDANHTLDGAGSIVRPRRALLDEGTHAGCAATAFTARWEERLSVLLERIHSAARHGAFNHGAVYLTEYNAVAGIGRVVVHERIANLV
jgi:hypothetical protein